MNILLSVIQIWRAKLEKKKMAHITFSRTHSGEVMIKTKAASPDDCKYIKINEENGFYSASLPM